MNELLGFFEKFGVLGVFLGMFLESMGIPGAGAALDIISGPLIHEGKYSPLLIISIAVSGLTLGSLASYLIGMHFSEKVLSYLQRKKRYEIYQKAEEIAKKYEKQGIFLAQLYGTTRTFVSYPAGILRINIADFLIFPFAGGLIYCLLITFFSSLIYGLVKHLYRIYLEHLHWQIVVGFLLTALFISVLVYIGFKNQAQK